MCANLEREIAALTRKAARKIVSRKSLTKPLTIQARRFVKSILGPAPFTSEDRGTHHRIWHRDRPRRGRRLAEKFFSLKRHACPAGKLDSHRVARRCDERKRANRVEFSAQPSARTEHRFQRLTIKTTFIFMCPLARRRKMGRARA